MTVRRVRPMVRCPILRLEGALGNGPRGASPAAQEVLVAGFLGWVGMSRDAGGPRWRCVLLGWRRRGAQRLGELAEVARGGVRIHVHVGREIAGGGESCERIGDVEHRGGGGDATLPYRFIRGGQHARRGELWADGR